MKNVLITLVIVCCVALAALIGSRIESDLPPVLVGALVLVIGAMCGIAFGVLISTVALVILHRIDVTRARNAVSEYPPATYPHVRQPHSLPSPSPSYLVSGRDFIAETREDK